MESELFLSILSSMAEGESASISENNKWSIKKRFLDGTYKLGYVPYGYRWKNGEILIDPAQAEIVKRIFRELLSGKGTEAIAKELNQEQVPTKKGGRWTSTSIRDIIRNEKYTGDCIFQKTYTDSNFNRHKNDGHLDQYYVPDHHEAIISHEDFEAAAALIEQRASEKGIKKGNAKYQQRYAFSGKIICGECGNTFRRRIHSNTYGKYAAWVCNTHLEDTSRCSMLYIRDDDLKLAFTTMINKLVYCRKLVLKSYLKALQENTGDASLLNIQQLEILLEQNTEQRERCLPHQYTSGIYHEPPGPAWAQLQDSHHHLSHIHTAFYGNCLSCHLAHDSEAPSGCSCFSIRFLTVQRTLPLISTDHHLHYQYPTLLRQK